MTTLILHDIMLFSNIQIHMVFALIQSFHLIIMLFLTKKKLNLYLYKRYAYHINFDSSNNNNLNKLNMLSIIYLPIKRAKITESSMRIHECRASYN